MSDAIRFDINIFAFHNHSNFGVHVFNLDSAVGGCNSDIGSGYLPVA